MVNKTVAQTERNIFQQQSHSIVFKGTHGSVRQDKRAFARDRIASPQPALLKKVMRSHEMASANSRSQKNTSDKRRLAPITIQVRPVVKAELQRMAVREKLSISSVSAALLEKTLQQNIDMQYGALLKPIIKHEIQSQMRAYSSRIALLLVRVAFASEQTRNLVTNILARQPGVKPDMLDHILDSSSSAAKSKITAKTPQLESIIAEVEQWFDQEGGGN